MTDMAPSAKTPTPAIYALTIERFPGITALRWKPSRGVTVILGDSNVGKTTILEAISLPLSPINPTTLSDPDSTTTETLTPGSSSRPFSHDRPALESAAR